MRSSIKMTQVTWISIILVFLIPEYEATAPLFLQAITSALATIPFTGGPMTTGLVGAKLAIGAKLLYFLGLFGRRSAPKPVSPLSVPKKTSAAGFGGGMQPVPLPYFLSGGGGGFPQMGNNFEAMNAFGQGSPFGGMDPSQVFQALRAQGFDANAAMEMMNYGTFGNGGGGFGNGEGFGNGAFGNGAGFGNGKGGGFGNGAFGNGGGLGNAGGFGQGPFGNGGGLGNGGFGNGAFGNGGEFGNGQFPNISPEFPESKPVEGNEDLPSQNPSEEGPDDIESFFTFLRGMDDNSCISRLVCDIGNDPSFLGDFSENIHNLVGSLDVDPSSGAYPYMQIMDTGRKEGNCGGRFPACSDMSYDIVKNVAPSVDLPDNIREVSNDL